MYISTPWTPAEDETALQHLCANKTFSEISRLMSRSRNSIISRANRKCWSYPNKKANGKMTHRSLTPAALTSRTSIFPQKIQKPKEKEEIIPFHTVLLDIARENQCRFIHGDPRQRLCCGDPTVDGRPWCARHAPMMYGLITRIRSGASPQDSKVQQVSN